MGRSGREKSAAKKMRKKRSSLAYDASSSSCQMVLLKHNWGGNSPTVTWLTPSLKGSIWEGDLWTWGIISHSMSSLVIGLAPLPSKESEQEEVDPSNISLVERISSPLNIVMVDKSRAQFQYSDTGWQTNWREWSRSWPRLIFSSIHQHWRVAQEEIACAIEIPEVRAFT